MRWVQVVAEVMKSDKNVIEITKNDENDCRKKWPSGRKPQTKQPRKIHGTGPPPRERFFTKNDIRIIEMDRGERMTSTLVAIRKREPDDHTRGHHHKRVEEKRWEDRSVRRSVMTTSRDWTDDHKRVEKLFRNDLLYLTSMSSSQSQTNLLAPSSSFFY